MSRLACWLLMPVLVAWFVPAALAQGDRIRIPEINDQAKLFSDKGKDKVNEMLDAIQRRFKLDLAIDTLEQGPKVESASWARSKAKEKGVNGVYVVITKEPRHFEVVVSDSAYKRGLLKTEDGKQLAKLLGEKLKGTTNDQAKRDEAVLAAASFVLQKFEENQRTTPATTPAPAKKAAGKEAEHPAQARDESIPWGKYLLIGLAVLVVFWIVIALIRAFSGAAAGPGMAGPGGYGGGGFFSSLLGGLFGAAAGMWLYSSFFGHNTPSAHAGDPGAAPTSGDANDPGGYTSAGGGDYDDAGKMPEAEDGGGDWGGGGGDWGDGGGGDFGGGGDW